MGPHPLFDKITNINCKKPFSEADNWWENSFKGEVIDGKMFYKDVMGVLDFF